MKKQNIIRIIALFILPAAAIIVAVIFNKCIRMSDWIVLSSGILTYAGTVLLGYFAMQKSEDANILSERLLKVEEREFVPAFFIENVRSVSFSKCVNREPPISENEKNHRVSFCQIDSEPGVCKGYNIILSNLSKYPITSYTLRHTYSIGKQGKKENQERTIRCIIPPNAQYSLDVCNMPKLELVNNIRVCFSIECTNDFGMSYKVELEIDYTDLPNPSYRCRVAND